jgi:hypothetical protein
VFTAGDSNSVDLELQPYESRLIFLTESAIQRDPMQPAVRAPARTINLASDWKVTFREIDRTVSMATLHSWSEDPALQYYSGQASYRKTFHLTAQDLNPGITAVLDFGPGTPLEEPTPLPQHSMKAYLEGPIREAAEVYVNGDRAGFVWRPPYKIDVTELLKPGENDLRIIVGNTAINSLAGSALPTYRLLNQRFGQRFVPQDMVNLEALPSGILGDLRLNLAPRSPAK